MSSFTDYFETIKGMAVEGAQTDVYKRQERAAGERKPARLVGERKGGIPEGREAGDQIQIILPGQRADQMIHCRRIPQRGGLRAADGGRIVIISIDAFYVQQYGCRLRRLGQRSKDGGGVAQHIGGEMCIRDRA